MWTIAFLTGSPAGDVLTHLQSMPGGAEHDEFFSVYVPTTPNPTGGYLPWCAAAPAWSCR